MSLTEQERRTLDRMRNDARDAMVGRRVECLAMNDVDPVPAGTLGTVSFVDDADTIHVRWDNGRTLGLVMAAGDRYRLLPEEWAPVLLREVQPGDLALHVAGHLDARGGAR